jgi:hypothetical protein
MNTTSAIDLSLLESCRPAKHQSPAVGLRITELSACMRANVMEILVVLAFPEFDDTGVNRALR